MDQSQMQGNLRDADDVEADQADARSRALSAADQVRDAILSGSLIPGRRINEVHLARDLGMSRTPTRAALHTLAAEGLIDYERNRGFIVREFPLQAVLDAYEIRASLEGVACRLAAERGLSGAQQQQIEAALRLGAPVVELHTGEYAHAEGEARAAELKRLADMAALAASYGIEPHAGHGLTYENVQPVAAIPQLAELNIGHYLIGEAIFCGLEPAVLRMRELMDAARAGPSR